MANVLEFQRTGRESLICADMSDMDTSDMVGFSLWKLVEATKTTMVEALCKKPCCVQDRRLQQSYGVTKGPTTQL